MERHPDMILCPNCGDTEFGKVKSDGHHCNSAITRAATVFDHYILMISVHDLEQLLLHDRTELINLHEAHLFAISGST